MAADPNGIFSIIYRWEHDGNVNSAITTAVAPEPPVPTILPCLVDHSLSIVTPTKTLLLPTIATPVIIIDHLPANTAAIL